MGARLGEWKLAQVGEGVRIPLLEPPLAQEPPLGLDLNPSLGEENWQMVVELVLVQGVGVVLLLELLLQVVPLEEEQPLELESQGLPLEEELLLELEQPLEGSLLGEGLLLVL